VKQRQQEQQSKKKRRGEEEPQAPPAARFENVLVVLGPVPSDVVNPITGGFKLY
jgi:hypothetical protein